MLVGDQGEHSMNTTIRVTAGGAIVSETPTESGGVKRFYFAGLDKNGKFNWSIAPGDAVLYTDPTTADNQMRELAAAE